jgi:hypothetical protein
MCLASSTPRWKAPETELKLSRGSSSIHEPFGHASDRGQHGARTGQIQCRIFAGSSGSFDAFDAPTLSQSLWLAYNKRESFCIEFRWDRWRLSSFAGTRSNVNHSSTGVAGERVECSRAALLLREKPRDSWRNSHKRLWDVADRRGSCLPLTRFRLTKTCRPEGRMGCTARSQANEFGSSALMGISR